MANVCLVCSKRPQVGNTVSNANNRVKRWIYPNVHVMRFKIRGQSKIRRGAVCTKCVKCGRAEKVI